MSQENWLNHLAEWLSRENAATSGQEIQQMVLAASQLELDSLLGVLQHLVTQIEPDSGKPAFLLQILAVRCKQLQATEPLVLDSRAIAELYEQLFAIHQLNAGAHLLQILAMQGDEDSVRELAEVIKDSPLEDWQLVGLALSPLWEKPAESIENFFEALGNDYLHPAATGVLLDLANFSLRAGKFEEHPWKNRSKQLSDLLQQLVSRLRKLERDPQQFGDSVEEVQRALGDSVSLTVSLCDALGWIGSSDCQEVLEDTLTLSHRRIQTEAAAALARMDSEVGKSRLLDLAADSAARLRVVAYAEELGLTEELDGSFCTAESLAESELASWLAEAPRFGFPPQQLELVDNRVQYWPSYDEPRECYLFRYTYAFPQGQVRNIGIAGPLTHTFTTNLENLEVEDQYAVFAGWQAEHEDIYEVPASEFNITQQNESAKLSRYLKVTGFDSIDPIALAMFFGDIALVGYAELSGQRVTVVSDGNEVVSFPITATEASMTPETTLCLYRGRKILRSFNP
ncbi:MAG: HEAT repeat domain-containing protein [Planctomycetota bacterium]